MVFLLFRAKSGDLFFFFFQAEDGIRDPLVTGVQTCALPISGVAAAVGCALLAAWALVIPAPSAPVSARAEHAGTTTPLLALLAVFFFVYVGLAIGFAGWITTYG